MDALIYEKLNEAFKKTSKILLGGEIGDLKDYENYLMEDAHRLRIEPSTESGKDVYISSGFYPKRGKFISFDEVNFFKKFEPLNINEIKDIDSIVEAIKERGLVKYVGNVILGNSRAYSKVDKIFNSIYVYNGYNIYESKFVAYSSFIRYGEYCFGVHGAGEASFSMRNAAFGLSRKVFESTYVTYSSNIYFSSLITGSNNVMFSFNQYGRNYIIGNLEIGRDKFNEISTSLIEQIREEIIRGKAPSLKDILSSDIDDETVEFMNELSKEYLSKNMPKKKTDMEPIEKSFRITSKLVLKKELSPIKEYENYLSKNVLFNKPTVGESLLGKERVITYNELKLKGANIKRFLTSSEALFLTDKLRMKEENLKNIDLRKIIEESKKIAFLSLTYGGNSENIIDTVGDVDTVNAYRVVWSIKSENTVASFWPRNSKYIFGSSSTMSSSFCINCYYVENIKRGFEVDSSYNSSDVYFSHNVENVNDCMFCFNVKNLKNAIGNGELSRERYLEVKKKVLEEIADELEKKKDLKWDIYNIGEYGNGE